MHPIKTDATLTRGQLRRNLIITLEVLVLSLAILLDGHTQPAAPTSDSPAPVAVEAAPVLRSMTAFVDAANRVYVMDAGVGTLQAQFAPCPFMAIDLVLRGDFDNLRVEEDGYYGAMRFAASFDGGDYHTISSPDSVTLNFEDGRSISLQRRCTPKNGALQVTVRGTIVYLTNSTQTQQVPLFSLMPLCDVVWSVDGEVQRAAPAQMAHPVDDPHTGVAFRFQVDGTALNIADSGFLSATITHQGGVVTVSSGCAEQFIQQSPSESLVMLGEAQASSTMPAASYDVWRYGCGGYSGRSGH